MAFKGNYKKGLKIKNPSKTAKQAILRGFR